MDAKPAEQPYVVMFSAFHTLSAAGGRLGGDKIQECWTFTHPNYDVVVDQNSAYSRPLFLPLSKLIRPFSPLLR
jgi:hypothetical protein